MSVKRMNLRLSLNFDPPRHPGFHAPLFLSLVEKLFPSGFLSLRIRHVALRISAEPARHRSHWKRNVLPEFFETRKCCLVVRHVPFRVLVVDTRSCAHRERIVLAGLCPHGFLLLHLRVIAVRQLDESVGLFPFGLCVIRAVVGALGFVDERLRHVPAGFRYLRARHAQSRQLFVLAQFCALRQLFFVLRVRDARELVIRVGQRLSRVRAEFTGPDPLRLVVVDLRHAHVGLSVFDIGRIPSRVADVAPVLFEVWVGDVSVRVHEVWLRGVDAGFPASRVSALCPQLCPHGLGDEPLRDG